MTNSLLFHPRTENVRDASDGLTTDTHRTPSCVSLGQQLSLPLSIAMGNRPSP